MVYAYSHAAGLGLGFLNFLGSILFFVFLFFIIKSVIYYFASKNGGKVWSCSSRHKSKEDEAIMVARERFAKGEITTEEFSVLKSGLGVENTENSSSPHWGFSSRDKALSIARLRFAKGEITLEEFETVKKAL